MGTTDYDTQKKKKEKKKPCLIQNEITLNLKGQKCTLGKNLKDQF